MAYRDVTGTFAGAVSETGTSIATGERKYVKQAGSLNSDDDGDGDGDEWADTDVAMQEAKRGSDGKIIRVLEDTPDWFEKYSSFLCKKEPEVVLLTLKDMFQRDDRITFEIPESHFQIKGSVLLDGQKTKFHITIFRDTQPNEFLVEFQRQSGCPADFLAFFRQSRAHISNNFKDFLVSSVVGQQSPGVFKF